MGFGDVSGFAVGVEIPELNFATPRRLAATDGEGLAVGRKCERVNAVDEGRLIRMSAEIVKESPWRRDLPRGNLGGVAVP